MDDADGAEPTRSRRLFELVADPEFSARYKVGRALGRGAMGVVFAGEQVSTGRQVAVKFMLRLEDAGALARLQREGLALARVAHPGLTRVLDCDSVQGFPYIVTELMAPGTLADRIVKQGKLTVAETLAIAQEVLPALQACHDAGVIHRDVKPDNILFDESGRARLADLGVARFEGAARVLTATGAVIGTPLYVAPELLRGEEAAGPSDVYAFGCSLHQMLSGDPPFRATELARLLKAHLDEAPPRLDEKAGTPTAVALVVERLLAKKAADRPPSAAAALAELERAVAGGGPASRPSGRVRRAQAGQAPQPPQSPQTLPGGAAPRTAAGSAPDPGSQVRTTARSSRVATAAGAARPSGRSAAAAGASAVALVALALWATRSFRDAPPVPVISAAPVASATSPRADPAPSGADASQPAARIAPMGDGGGTLPRGALGRLGALWGQHPHLDFADASADAALLVTASSGSARAWDGRAGRMIAGWRGEANTIAGVYARPADESAVLACQEDSIWRARDTVAKVASNTMPLDLVIWTPRTGAVRTLRGPQQVGAWTIAPGGRYAAWYDGIAGGLVVRGLDSAGTAVAFGASEPPAALALSADGRVLVVLRAGGVEVRTPGAAPRQLPGAGHPAELALSPDGARIAAASPAGVSVVEVASGIVRGTSTGPARQPCFAPDGQRLVVAAGDRLHLLDAASLRTVQDLPGAPFFRLTTRGVVRFTGTEFDWPGAPPPVRGPRVLALDPGARFAVLERPDHAVVAWHRTGGPDTVLLPRLDDWTIEGTSRDGLTVHFRRAPGGDRDQILPVDVRDGVAGATLEIPHTAGYVPLSGPGRYATILSDLTVMVVSGPGRTRMLSACRLAGGAAPGVRTRPFGPIDLAERRIVIASPEKGLVVLDLVADATHTLWSATQAQLFGWPRVGIALEGRGVVLGPSDGVLHVMRTGSAEASRSLTHDSSAILALAVSDDARSVAAGYASGAILLWDLATGRARDVVLRGGLEVRKVALDAGAGILLSVDDGGILTAWDVASRR